MKIGLSAFLCLTFIGCAHFVYERSPSQAPSVVDIKSFGNFFQKVKIKSSKKTGYASKFESILGKKIQVQYSLLDLPEISSTILNQNGWSVELAGANGQSSDIYSNYILDILLSEISEAQFNELKKAMRSPIDLKWDPKKQYSIVDFMPISAQALYGNYYIHNRFTYDKKTLPWHYKFKEITNEGQVSRISNCWHAAWEYLQAANDKISIFFAGEEHIRPILEDNKYSAIVKEFTPKQIEILFTSPKTFFNGIESGDLILIYQTMQNMTGEFEALAHVAIAIDNNIVFEKMNPISNLPYRLAYLTDSIDNLIYINKSDIKDKTTSEHLASLRIVVRRFIEKLPPLRTQINMQKKPGVFLDMNELKAKDRPTQEFMSNHTIVTELGTGGTIISEDLYKIQDVEILKKDGKYELDNSFNYP